ncbi:hypothetical protein SAMN05421676_103198 [Salinibacillus kushneri]|uniref:Tetratricopeptide repeat-containing protein n=1 Tax=Salinibacillus kushneri TaxID=237682 RepID=A0A1I0CL95_9BACI|nr:hypothetical protein [Salinibacillus kushneri]SET19965.1 hypothetical protein SAMN05421676_103198 [Salinibacillus kushneri]
MPTLISINHQKQNHNLEVSQMAIYFQSKIVEAFDDEYTYYLFFYKDQYLTYVKSPQLKKGSFVNQAFSSGIVFSAQHPLTEAFLTSEKSFRKHSFSQVLKKNEQKYTPHEAGLIATFFDAFIDEEELVSYLKELFYRFRRNGQTFLSYRFIQLLLDVYPDHTWVQDFAKKMEFQKYADLYANPTHDLFKKDPLFAEKTFFLNLQDDSYYENLYSLLKQENRWIDLLAITIKKFSMNPTDTQYRFLYSILEEHLTSGQIVNLLESLLASIGDFKPIVQDVVKLSITLNQPHKIVDIISTHSFTIPESEIPLIESMLDQIDVYAKNIKIEKLNQLLPHLYKSDSMRLEKLLNKCVNQLLLHHDLSYVAEWVEPVKSTHPELPILCKINQMLHIQNDPDQQQLLGELYFQFEHYNQAIECFSFEMELKENDPKPVKWLSKVYQELGMQEESKAYQQLYKDIQKRA